MPAGSFTALSAGNNFACAIKAGGTVCWGNNSTRQAQPPADAFAQISASKFPLSQHAGKHGGFACGLLKTGGVRCWGAILNMSIPARP
jgi:hypothetical protein